MVTLCFGAPCSPVAQSKYKEFLSLTGQRRYRSPSIHEMSPNIPDCEAEEEKYDEADSVYFSGGYQDAIAPIRRTYLSRRRTFTTPIARSLDLTVNPTDESPPVRDSFNPHVCLM